MHNEYLKQDPVDMARDYVDSFLCLDIWRNTVSIKRWIYWIANTHRHNFAMDTASIQKHSK
jgi:hypothetical protein